MTLWTKLAGVGVAAVGAAIAVVAAKKYGKKGEPECEEFEPAAQPVDFDEDLDDLEQDVPPVEAPEEEEESLEELNELDGADESEAEGTFEPETTVEAGQPASAPRRGVIGNAVAGAARAVTDKVADAAQRVGVDTDEVGSALSDAGRALGVAGRAMFDAGTVVAYHAAVEAKPILEKAKGKAGELWQNVRTAASASEESEAAPSDFYAAPDEEQAPAEEEDKDKKEE